MLHRLLLQHSRSAEAWAARRECFGRSVAAGCIAGWVVGLGDRAPRSKWQRVTGPVDVVVLEGWCLGFRSTHDGARCPPRMRNVDAHLADFEAVRSLAPTATLP